MKYMTAVLKCKRYIVRFAWVENMKMARLAPCGSATFPYRPAQT